MCCSEVAYLTQEKLDSSRQAEPSTVRMAHSERSQICVLVQGIWPAMFPQKSSYDLYSSFSLAPSYLQASRSTYQTFLVLPGHDSMIPAPTPLRHGDLFQRNNLIVHLIKILLYIPATSQLSPRLLIRRVRIDRVHTCRKHDTYPDGQYLAIADM